MIKEVIGEGASIEEAKDNAFKLLCVSADADVNYDIIEYGSESKFFGLIKGKKAQVKATIELPDSKPKREKKPFGEKSAISKKQTEGNQLQKKEKPVQSKKTDKSAPKFEEKNAEKPAEIKEDIKAEANDYSKLSVAEDYAPCVALSTLSEDSVARQCGEYVERVLKAFGCKAAVVTAYDKDSTAFINVQGEDCHIAIGHKGDTIDALQYLAGLACTSFDGFYKVSLNISNYREKREKVLTELAGKVANQVLKSNRSRALEPMNPFERRIIHSAIQEIEGVYSASVGEGNGRRVVVAPEGTTIKPMRRDSHNDRRSRNDRGRRDRKPSQIVETKPTREPKSDGDLPRYGKIN